MSEFRLKSGNATPFKLMGSSPAKQGLIWNKKIEKQMKEGFKEKMGPKGKKTYVKPEKEGKGKYHYKKSKHPKRMEVEDEAIEPITRSAGERVNDIEDRIGFLHESVHSGTKTQKEVDPAIAKLKIALKKARKEDK